MSFLICQPGPDTKTCHIGEKSERSGRGPIVWSDVLQGRGGVNRATGMPNNDQKKGTSASRGTPYPSSIINMSHAGFITRFKNVSTFLKRALGQLYFGDFFTYVYTISNAVRNESTAKCGLRNKDARYREGLKRPGDGVDRQERNVQRGIKQDAGGNSSL